MSPLVDSSSDEDVPLAVRKAQIEVPAAKAAPSVPIQKEAPPSESEPLKQGANTEPAPAKQEKASAAVEKRSTEKPVTAPALKEEKAAPVKKEPIKAEQSPVSSPSKLPKVKKEYALPGQTRDTPEEGDPLRKFYTSLLQQRPDSEMARKWCVMYGLLSEEEAQAYVDLVASRKAESRPPSRTATSNGRTTPAKKRAATPSSTPTSKKPTASSGRSKTPSGGKTASTPSNTKARKQVAEPEVDDASEDEVIPAKKSRALAEEWSLTGSP